MSFDGVIFDMDGTLIESHLDFAVIRAQLGIGEDEGIIESIEAMEPLRAKLAREKLNDLELASVRQAAPLAGCHKLLSEIKLAGMKMALLTRNSAEAMAIALDKIGSDYFDITWSREQGPIKPEPDGVLRACREMGILPEKQSQMLRRIAPFGMLRIVFIIFVTSIWRTTFSPAIHYVVGMMAGPHMNVVEQTMRLLFYR